MPGTSLSVSCEGHEALLEGSYRFLRNKRINANQIAEGGYNVTCWLSESTPTLLAIEDTTTLSYTHQVISVCDREGDIFEYIQYKLEHNQRFIVRGSHNRKLEENNKNYLFQMLSSAILLGTYTIEIAQKSNRKKRQVTLELNATTVTFSPSERRAHGARELKPITLNRVIAQEKMPSEEDPLEWVLLTTEAITTCECTRKITRYYEMRWRIEDVYKAWKSGAGVEAQRMQSIESLENMIVILSFIAIRLLQLKEHFEYPALDMDTNKTYRDELLTDTEWKVLWHSVEKKLLPEKNPTAAWAYKAIARLGGWTDSKRTGKAAWSTIWKGWFRWKERIEGFRRTDELMTR